jgi:hypothetical protein
MNSTVKQQKIQSIAKVVSGGQTGADRAGLDWAIAHNIPHSGWCPKGRKAEDGPITARYELQETSSEAYQERTEWNVRDSDGTVIFSLRANLTGGSRLTRDFAIAMGKPWLHLSASQEIATLAHRLNEFIVLHNIRTLNIAGTRKSGEPAVGEFVTTVLTNAFPHG